MVCDAPLATDSRGVTLSRGGVGRTWSFGGFAKLDLFSGRCVFYGVGGGLAIALGACSINIVEYFNVLEVVKGYHRAYAR